jgi:hypothetical protein
METSTLIQHFSMSQTLPIDVNDVLEQLSHVNDPADVSFIGVDFDIDILQGKIKIWYDRNGVYGDELKKMANIYYHRGHTRDWQRFICCKELMHLLDPLGAHTSTLEAIEQLAEKIGLPPEMQDPMADGFAANTDRVAEYRAAAVLLPLNARERLLEPLARDAIKLVDIATLADMPRKYVALVMGAAWPQIHEILIS